MKKISGISILFGLVLCSFLNLFFEGTLAAADQTASSSERRETTVPMKILELYVGVYQFPGFRMMIKLENGQLISQVIGSGGKAPLFAKSENEFFPKVGDRIIDDELKFIRDEKGKVSGLVLSQRPSGRVTKAPKISDEVPQHKEIPVSDKILESYVGTYKSEPGIDEKITLEGNRLFTQITGQDKFPLSPESETRFYLAEMDAQREFVKNDKGEVTHLIRRQGPSEIRVPRIDNTGNQKGFSAIDGIWTGTANGPGGKPLALTYEFEAAGKILVGTIWSALGGGPFSEGEIEGNKISFVVRTDQFTIETSGALYGDRINLTQRNGDSTTELIVKRAKFNDASNQPDIAGEYQGTGPRAGQPPISLQIERKAGGGWIGRLQQGPQPIPIDSVDLQGSKIKYSTSAIVQSSYEGSVSEDGAFIKETLPPPGVPALHFLQISRETSPHTTRFVTVDKDVKLEVLDWGGSGKALILLAGAIVDAHTFDKIAPRLTDSYHVYAITRRVRITSGSPYTSDRLGDDILAVVTALNLDRPVLAGSSYAGEELSNIGWRYPEKVSGLIYLDAAFSYPPAQDKKYPEIKVPVLGIFPEGPQSNYPVFKMDAPASLSAKIVLLPNASHLIYWTNEAEVVREMKAFMRGLPGK